MKLRTILRTNWLATFRLNYNAGGWRAVMRMPIKVYGPLKLNIRGKIVLPKNAQRNTLVINSEHEDYTATAGKAELNIQGTWKVNGFLRIGPDACIAIEEDALLETGTGTYLGRDTQIHCSHHISIGKGVFAGETYICDSAIHQIVSAEGTKPMLGKVIIGDDTYLGFRAILLKGTSIPPRSVVGSGAVCTSDFSKHGTEKLFICGNPAVVKATDVTAIF
ncbi:MAG: hypothetical protein IJ219_00260 [Bacteroidaceae bacterium]|nr:hypothetical protein [Bacteroidaceae bacterium]MBQ9169222.1 hypothetical protein [Bacteroidaceae bacterium]MBQ9293344.1 hypothetical protein [Bacteroidaceae bacterium]